MGLLIDGVWHDDDSRTLDAEGRMRRAAAGFRNWITADGSPGPSGEGGFKAEAGRYHLIVARACPWAHRTTIVRELKGLQNLVSLSVTHWLMAENGWTFAPGPGVTADPIIGADYLHQIYAAAAPGYTGRVSVPVLWDKQKKTVVSNESSEIIRMFNGAFDGLGAAPGDFYPAALRPEIDALNERIYTTLNNGVYRAGFAGTQAAYDEAIGPLFDTLDWLEGILSRSRYLTGDRLTEADWRLFTTLVRFDPVYVGHFKCNLRRLIDYPALWSYVRELFQMPGIRGTVDFDHIMQHYYASHRRINPTGIVPKGPILDFEAPPSR
ncbi:glutathione S-transferase family protein [Phreatobacter stygius]|uniref:Glutathione S-transferase family protein n=1 Tax=Phreatobacter stygius TaxID=1940610 RepID=A0A4D7BJ95_9HYPH|nr:glutathione S-transferase family protein [Phreatobacter stygius]QCI67852.1 glutathione S-transferase family protein [Phreatobacter stygius]